MYLNHFKNSELWGLNLSIIIYNSFFFDLSNKYFSLINYEKQGNHHLHLSGIFNNRII